MIGTSWFVLSIAMVSVTLLALAAGFHFYWGFGGQVGRNISVPQREDGTPVFTPSSLATHAVGFTILIVIGSVFLSLWPALLPLSPIWTKIMTVFFALIFLARALSWQKYVGLFKSVRATEFGK